LSRLTAAIENLETRLLFAVVGPFDQSTRTDTPVVIGPFDSATPVDIPVGNVKPGDQIKLSVNFSTTDPDDQSEGEPLIISGSDGTEQSISDYGKQDVYLDVSQTGETFSAYIEGADGDENATIAVNGGAVVVEDVSTSDSKSLTVEYNVEDNPDDDSFPLDIYRAMSPDSDYDAEISIAHAQLLPADATEGDHTITISPSGTQYTFSQAQALRPDLSYKYVVAEADNDGTLDPQDATDTPSDSFRIWVVGAVTHGYTFGILNQLFPAVVHSVSAQTWVDTDAQNLVDDDDYDEGIAFHWEQGSIAKQTGVTVAAGDDMADAIAGIPFSDGNSFETYGSISPTDNDVVDVSLVGHSRGGVVISYAADALDSVGDSHIDAGIITETMLDPHPANNSFGQMYHASFAGRYLPVPYIFGIGTAVQRYKNFQNYAQDPSAFVPADVDAAVGFYQRTASGTLNLWGENPSDIEAASPDAGAALNPIQVYGKSHSTIIDVFANAIDQDTTLSILGFQPFGDSDPLTITTPPPTTVTAGTPFSVTVTAENADGTVNTSFNEPITLSSDDGNTLGGTLTVTAVNGVATFAGITDNKAGYDALDFNNIDLGEVSCDDFTINPGPAAALDIEGPNGTGANNVIASPFGLDVDIDDAYGNEIDAYTGNVTLALGSNPGNSTLGGTLTVPVEDGEASFEDLTLNNLGSGYTLVANSPGLTTDTSVPFSIADELEVTTAPPETVTAGAPFGLTVTAEAGSGNVDTSYNGPITLTLSNYQGSSTVYTLNGTLSENAVNGVATFSGLTENLAGSFGLVVSGNGNLTPNSTLFTVAAAPATKLVVASPPTRVTNQAPLSVTVNAEDAFGNIDMTYTGAVTLSVLASAGGAVVSQTTADAYAGAATFTGITMSTAQSGGVLQASSSGLTTGTTPAITVTPAGVATQLVVTTEPTTPQTAGTPFGLVVNAEDGNGTLDTTYNGPVTLSLANLIVSAPLTGTVTVNAVAGVATFSNVIVDQAAISYTLTATASGLTSSTTTDFDVDAAAATTLVIVGPGTGLVTNAGFGLTVNAEDPYGNIDPNFNGEVDLTLAANPGNATIGGDVTAYASSGVASFTGVTLSAAGSGYTLSATANTSGSTLTPATSTPFSVNNDQLEITSGPPSITTPGSPFSLTLSAQNSTGAVDGSFNGPVTLSLIRFGGGTGSLAGTLTATAVNGVATFPGLSFTGGGQFGIQASASGAGPVTTGTIDVIAVPTKLGFVVQPPPAITVGASFAVSIEAEDASGNLVSSYSGSATVSLGGGTAGATLGGTTTVNFTDGIATLSGLTLSAAGTGYTLLASSGALTAATSSALNALPPGVATRLLITTQPATTVTGNSAFGLTVTAEDSFGTVAAAYTGPVTISLGSNLFGSTLSGTVTVNAVNGVANFSTLSIYQSGSYTVIASAAGLGSATSSAFTVTTPAATELAVQNPSSNVLTNGAFTLTVDAEDAFGTIDTDFTGTVSVSLNSAAGGSLGGTLTATAVGGVATFSGLAINAAGGADIITAASAGLTSGATQPFAVTNDQLVITTSPNSPTAGQGFGLIVEAENAAGALDPAFTGSITLSPSPAADGTQPVLGGTFTRSAVGGIAAFFGLTLTEAGEYVITADANGVGSGDSPAFAIVGGKATHVGVASMPTTPTTVGAPFEVDIAAEDGYGNPDLSFNGPVTLSIASGSGVLGGTLTVNAVDGVASFTPLTLNAAGSYTLIANGDGFSVTTAAVSITPIGTATTLEFSVQPPASVVAGATFSVTVTAVDSLGNLASSFTGPVTLSEASGADILGTLTVNAVNGVATFTGLSIDAAGYGYSLIASASGLAAANGSGSLNVTAGKATQLVIGETNGNVLPGMPFSVSVFAEDAYGNVDTTFSGPVTFTLPAGSGQTLGGITTVNAVNGVAAFNDLTLSSAISSNTLQAAGGSLTTTATVASTNDQLVMTVVPPAEVGVNGAFSFSVSALNAAGGLDTNYNGTITISLLDYQSTGATLAGTLTVTAVNGVATFSGLSINLAGAYGLTIVGSNAGATTSALTVQPASAPASTIVPSFGRYKLPAIAIAGQKVAISLPLTLKATTASFKGKFVVYLYADASTTLDGQQVLLGTYTLSAALKAKKSRAMTLRLTTLPAYLPAGTYHLLAEVVDPTGATSLVASSLTLVVVAPVVTLTASLGAVSPAIVKEKKAGSILLTIENTGNISAVGALSVLLSASTDGTAAGIAYSLGSLTQRINLAPKRKLSLRLRFKGPDVDTLFYPFVTLKFAGVTVTASGSAAKIV
jgi:dUTPase